MVKCLQHLMILMFLWTSSKTFARDDEAYARKLFERITGVPLATGDARLATMKELISQGKESEAALLATDDEHFYSVSLRNMVAPFSSIDESENNVLDDMQATVIGYVRDDRDMRGLLTGNVFYRAYDDLGLPEPAPENNEHYAQWEARGFDIKRNLMSYENDDPSLPEQSGVLTSRAFAQSYLQAGTNRRAVQYSMQIFLCAPITQWKDRGLPDYHVRRDVNRAPGGHPETYQNECRSCHAMLDAVAGAFARHDFRESRLMYAGPTKVWPKYNQNNTMYPEGFQTWDDSWTNYITHDQNVSFGWTGPLEGHGVKEFGTMLANSDAFSKCWARKVYRMVCRDTKLESLQASDLETWSEGFKNAAYKLRDLTAHVATSENCLSHND